MILCLTSGGTLPPGRAPFRRDPPISKDEHRINDRIRVPRVKVVDENGVMLGEMPTLQALQIARERGYDLVEVAAEARPPVCKLLDYGKYKYEQKKKQNKSKAKQHVQQVKEVRLRPLTGEHDLLTKLKKAQEMLLEGDKVLITIFFRGREQAHKEHGRHMMERIKKELDPVAKVEHEVSMTGPRMQMTFLPKPGAKAPAPKPAPKAPGEAAAAPVEGGPPAAGPSGSPAPVAPAPAAPPTAAAAPAPKGEATNA
ncbi:MAG: translation initiation factor IF-3 [Planctomycetes bacterium]|nr:translation initiation factor IF-3 [Planctomycetota bacterium]